MRLRLTDIRRLEFIDQLRDMDVVCNDGNLSCRLVGIVLNTTIGSAKQQDTSRVLLSCAAEKHADK